MMTRRLPLLFTTLFIMFTLIGKSSLVQGNDSGVIDQYPFRVDYLDFEPYDGSNVSSFSVYQDEEFHGYSNGSTYLVNRSLWLEDQFLFPVSDDVLVFRNNTTISLFENGSLSQFMDIPQGHISSFRIQKYNGTIYSLWSTSGYQESTDGLFIFSRENGYSNISLNKSTRVGNAFLMNGSIYINHQIPSGDGYYPLIVSKFSMDGTLEFDKELDSYIGQYPIISSIYEYEGGVVFSSWNKAFYISESGSVKSLDRIASDSISARSQGYTTTVFSTFKCESTFILVSDVVMHMKTSFTLNHISNVSIAHPTNLEVLWFDPHSCSGIGHDQDGNLIRFSLDSVELSPGISDFSHSSESLGISHAEMYFQNNMLEFNCLSAIDFLVYDHQEIKSIDMTSDGGVSIVNFSTSEVNATEGKYLLFTTFEFTDEVIDSLQSINQVMDKMNRSDFQLNVTFYDDYFGENHTTLDVSFDCINIDQDASYGIVEYESNLTGSNHTCSENTCFINSIPSTEVYSGKVVPTKYATSMIQNITINFTNDCSQLDVNYSILEYFLNRVEVSYECIEEAEIDETPDDENISTNSTEQTDDETNDSINPVDQNDVPTENETGEIPENSKSDAEFETWMLVSAIGVVSLLGAILAPFIFKNEEDD